MCGNTDTTINRGAILMRFNAQAADKTHKNSTMLQHGEQLTPLSERPLVPILGEICNSAASIRGHV